MSVPLHEILAGLVDGESVCFSGQPNTIEVAVYHGKSSIHWKKADGQISRKEPPMLMSGVMGDLVDHLLIIARKEARKN